MFSGPLIV